MNNKKRLIDAEELYKKATRAWDDTLCDVCYSEIINLIDESPIVDAAPVVHGRWVAVPSSDMMTGKAYKCSECNKMRYGSFMPNYCQNCGAKMDGGNEDGS